MGSHRVRHDWRDLAAAAALSHDKKTHLINPVQWLIHDLTGREPVRNSTNIVYFMPVTLLSVRI